MLLRVTILIVLASSALGADHNLFKNCSRVELCTQFRSFSPDDDTIFKLDPDSLEIQDGIVNVNLINNKGGEAKLHITALEGDKFRVHILDKDNVRYRLTDVLVEEPSIIPITYSEQTDNGVVVGVTKDSRGLIVVTNDPLDINIFYDNVLQTIIHGDHIYFENTEESQVFTLSLSFPQALRIHGLHEHTDHLSLQNTEPGGSDPYRLRNMDVYAADVWTPMAVYGAAPVLYGHGLNVTSGIFLHNAAQQWIEINKNGPKGPTAYFIVEGGDFDVFVLPGPTPKEVVRQFTSLTGKAHLPQLWALGYHQCRFSYATQEDAKEVVANMDSHNFQMDAIWLDIDYTDGKRYFTWNPEHFADPLELQQNISATNRKLVTIIDPHIKVDNDYFVYKAAAAEKDLFVRNPDGSNFEGNCWPGLSSWLDFLNPVARDFWAGLFSYENFTKSTGTLAGIWNDMNEPSVFDHPETENTLPSETRHIGDAKHRDLHNSYGFLQTKATHQGLMQRDNNTLRPFVLTRSTFAGSQRYAAFWTGDNVAEWSNLAVSFPECLNANILGIVFCGSDVGGFLRNPSDEMFQRWYQAGAWLPFYRAHSNSDTNRREPYLFNDGVQGVVREAIKVRYQHLPVWYTLFFEHTRTGDPLIRPLFYQYPDDPDVLDTDNEILVGRDILVHPVVEASIGSVKVYLPGSTDGWFQIQGPQNYFEGLTTQDVRVDMSFIPVFYRAGSIIPVKETARPSTTEMKADGFSLYINLDENQQADGTLYVDDYESFEYENEKKYWYANITWKAETQEVEITMIDDSADASGFDVKIDQLIVNMHVSGNQTYEQKRITTSADGTLLSDIKIDFTNNKFSLKL